MLFIQRFPNSQFYAFFFQPELYRKAVEIGYDNAVYFEKCDLKADEIGRIKAKDKPVICMFFDESQQSIICEIADKAKEDGIRFYSYCLDGFLPGYDDNDNVFSLYTIEKAAEYLKSYVFYAHCSFEGRGWVKAVDYEGRCGNCHAYIGENDKYCQRCGTLKGDGTFEPYDNKMYVVYGPPIITKWKCRECGYKWKTGAFDEERKPFCPQCGKNSSRFIEGKIHDIFSGFRKE